MTHSQTHTPKGSNLVTEVPSLSQYMKY